jgi:hypothetical protein
MLKSAKMTSILQPTLFQEFLDSRALIDGNCYHALIDWARYATHHRQ